MQIFFRTLAVAAALSVSAQAHAACEGTDLAPAWTTEFEEEVAAMANALPHPEGRLFEVSRNGSASVVFGTIHLSEAAVATPPAELIARVNDAEELFLEVTRDEEQRMMRNILLNPTRLLAPDGRKLSDALTAQEWTELEPLLTGYGITAQIAEQIAPWYLTITLANPSCLIAAAATGEAILDRRIELLAKEAGVTVTGLETFDDVFGLFENMAYDDQIRMLRAGLPTFALAEDYLETTKQLYLDGKIQQIWSFSALTVERDAATPDAVRAVEQFFEKLLVERNRRWLDALVPALAKGDRVVAVGALHLGGADGLLTLLEGEGFTVRRLD